LKRRVEKTQEIKNIKYLYYNHLSHNFVLILFVISFFYIWENVIKVIPIVNIVIVLFK